MIIENTNIDNDSSRFQFAPDLQRSIDNHEKSYGIKQEMLQSMLKPKEQKKEVKVIEVQAKPTIPQEFQWVLHLAKFKEQGYRLRYIYDVKGKKVQKNNLMYFQVDSACQSYVPVRPTTVLVQKFELNKGFVDIAELSGEKDFLDPDVDTAMNIFNVTRLL